MTTADRLRTFWGDREFDREGLTSLVTRYWEVAVFGVLMLVALGLRLPGLADRAIHHDESLHMIYSWHLFEGRGYEHVPFMHGPFQYFGNALVFRLWPFGATDFSGRLLYALFGSALVGLPYFLRGYIGRKGAIIAAVFLALSPTLWYFSRFARNDIYIAVFTLAMVIVIWRYLKEQNQALLFAVPLLLMLGFATKEVTFITVAIFLAYLEVQLTIDLVDQMRASRSMEPGEVVLAYVALLPTAWIVASLWPLLDGPRQRWSLATMPPAGHLLILMGTFSLPQFGPAVQKVPELVGNIPAIGDSLASFPPIDALRDRNVDAEAWSMHPDERALRWVIVVVTLAGTAAIGLLWNPRVWAIGAAIFYIPYFLLYTTFFTNGGDFWDPSGEFWNAEGGFWTGIWGSLDYWLSQQLVRRGSQPDYYYFVILPVYEFLPLVFALGGALFYGLRGKLEQTLLTVSALLLVILFIGLPDDTPVIGEYRIQASFVVVIAAVLLLSMDGFTKFLLFWTLATLFGISVAGEKMPWLTVHLAVPMALLAAKVLDDVLSTVGAEPRVAEPPSRGKRGRRRRREPEPAFTPNPLLLMALAATFALLAAIIFQFAGPASPLSALAWLLSLGALIVVIWAGSSVSLRTAGQAAAVSLAAAFLVFTVRAGAMAAYDEGDPNGIPREMFIYAQGSPGLNVVLDNTEELAFGPGGPGYDQKIVIDNTGNIWPWPWSLREYRSLQYEPFDEDTFTPEPGSVVLIGNQNQAKIEASLDQFHPSYAYTHMWWFREYGTYRDLELGSFLADFFRGRYFPAWRSFFIDRELKDPYPNHDMLAFFPKEFQEPDVPQPPDTPETATAIPEANQTLIGGFGTGPGQFSQPADLTLDSDGNLYVVDTLNHRVQRFAPDGTFINAVGEPGNGEGQFLDPYQEGEYEVHDGPWGVAVDEEGNVYVADTWNHRIQKFGPDFEFLLEWGAGELFGPRDIAIDDEGNVLVVDTGNKRILEYTPDGEAIGSHGQEGDGPGEFNEPSSISIAPDGDIYVADFWNRRIQHFDSAFGYVDEIGVDTWGSQGVTDRAYIVALEDGRVLATDPANGRFVVLGQDGEEEAAWRFSAVPSRPVGIAVDPLGRAYVADGLSSEVWRVPLPALLP